MPESRRPSAVPESSQRETPAAGIIRTVGGDIAPEELGRTNYHEHLFQVSPLLAGDELDNEEASGHEAISLVESGFGAMIEATPMGLGRNPSAVARIAARAGLHAVHVTGAHHGGHYPEEHPIRALTEDELVNRWTTEIRLGFGEDPAAVSGDESSFGERSGLAGDAADSRGVSAPFGASPVRAGMLKAGIRYWQIGPFERRALAAVARTHAETGAAIMVHLDYGSAAHEVLELLERDGVSRDRVVLAHIDRNLDSGLHADLIASGAYLGYDGPARHREAPDQAILECLERVVARVGSDRILLGGDVARASRYLAYGGMPGLEYLGRRFIPRLEVRLGADRVDALLADNAARLLTLAVNGG
ncbi:phosphotriesterase-related protein [Mycetocola sp. BIGb0189]|uniref:phosphotriesterase family protein n=1 Tax=Mycetocola sp. BIGb0189 TaxID=2940604 RepID=UPI0021689EC6|nr:aryldialkylphosphatase [Mycetocola sp. BIGb0189]MCS4274971.1 phosphotriesterase-related protein [Mycetocola sp. BIGb0189]